MAIFRGVGGAGEANDDATLNAVTEQAQDAAESATEAATSATAAANSATAAATSATNAAASESSVEADATAAASSASSAASSATTASTAATNAGTAQTAAETAQAAAEAAQTAAETAETNAETAETNAASSASSASTSATTATTQATAASTSATNAATSATAAAGSATTAASEASDAADSATAAASSETAAASSATAAASSAAAAANSESHAASSEGAAASSATAAASSATAAAASETAAAASESAAATSETNAAASESAASTSETNAAASATAAASSATAAQTAQTAAEAAQEAIDGLYLGAQTSDPTLDNNGDPVTAGDWYYNTSTSVTRIYDGSAWNNGAVSTASFALVSNNLSDLTSASTARTNLGLGTAATTASTDYATAAQGALADSATQPADNISTLTNDSGYITDYTVTSGDVTSALGYTPVDPAGDSMTGNLTFGDNDKAIFGAGSDLQIDHTGTDSRIVNTTGHLILRNVSDDKDIFLQTDDGLGGYDTYLLADGSAGSLNLYHNSSDLPKLATTSTGIDVTGTVTADDILISSSDPKISFIDTDTGADSRITANSGNGRLTIDADINDESTYSNISLRVDGKAVQLLSAGGDISFYESTGTTAKFFWDASAESLGIGTSSPTTKLDVNGTVNATAFTGDGSSLTGIDALPSQTGHSGQYLTTDGSTASWANTGAAAGMFWENDQTLSSDYTITSGKNAGTFGAVTIDTGVSVTVPTGSTWTIV